MQLVIVAPKSTATNASAELAWVTKGGSSIVSADNRWSLRKNSKGEWRVFLDGEYTGHALNTKDEAKAYAAMVSGASTAAVKGGLQDGTAQVYSLRADGTMRRRHYLTGADLTAAQAVRKARETDSMAKIANSLHVSVSQVRRMLIDLAITEELAEATEDQLASLLTGAQEA